jgi:gas vesicle protein
VELGILAPEFIRNELNSSYLNEKALNEIKNQIQDLKNELREHTDEVHNKAPQQQSKSDAAEL